MDPNSMAQFINTIPAPVGNPAPTAMPSAPMPAAPAYPPTPAAPIFNPATPPLFGNDVRTPVGNPPVPTNPLMPSVPGQPYGTPPQPAPYATPQPAYPINPLPAVPDANQIPEWGQQLAQAVIQMQNNNATPPQPDKPWDDNNRPRSWEEFYQAVNEMTDKKAAAKIGEFMQQQQSEAQQSAAAQAQVDQQLDTIEGQLVSTGLLPAVANPNDPNDPGRAAKAELYAYAIATGGSEPQHLAPAAATLRALHDSGWYFDRGQGKLMQRNSATPNAWAPIAGGAPSMPGGAPIPSTGNAPTNREFGTMPLANIVALGAARLGIN